MAIIASNINQIESIDYAQRDELIALLETSGYEERQRTFIKLNITLADTAEQYETIKANLLANQLGIDGAVNPGQREINRHLRKFIKLPS